MLNLISFEKSWIARKKEVRFELMHSLWLNDQKADKEYFLYCSRIYKNVVQECTYTECSHRFFTRDEAALFCEEIISGKIKISQLKEDESRAWSIWKENVYAEGRREFEKFVQFMDQLGVDVALLPEISKAYKQLGDHARSLLVDRSSIAQLNPMGNDSLDTRISRAQDVVHGSEINSDFSPLMESGRER